MIKARFLPKMVLLLILFGFAIFQVLTTNTFYDPQGFTTLSEEETISLMKTFGLDPETSIDYASFEERDGVPYIPFVSKSEIELLDLKKNRDTDSSQFSITKFMRENFNSTLAGELSSELEEQFLRLIYDRAEASAVSCEGTTNENLKVACAMCQTDKAYVLSHDNWFTVGIANNYKDEFAKFVFYVQYFFPSVRWLAAFGDDNICLASVTPAENIDLNYVLPLISSKDLCKYEKTTLIPLKSHTTVDLASLEYLAIGHEMSYVTDLVVKFRIDHKMKISDKVSLDVLNGWIRSEETKMLFTGVVDMGLSAPIPFSMEIHDKEELHLAKSDMTGRFLSLAEVLQALGAKDLTEINSVLHTKGGLSELSSYPVNELKFWFNEKDLTSVGVKIQLSTTQLYALTPEFNIQQPDSDLAIHILDGKVTTALLIKGVAIDSTGLLNLSAYIKQDKHENTITLTQHEKTSSTTRIGDLEKVFHAKDSLFKGLMPPYDGFQTLRNYYMNSLSIKIKQDPFPTYFIESSLSKEPVKVSAEGEKCESLIELPTTGKFEGVMSFIGGKMNVRTVMTFPKGSLSQLLPPEVPPPFYEKYAVWGDFVVTYSNQDLDTGLYAEAFKDFYNGDRFWIQGTFVQSKLSLSNCTGVAFCNFINSILAKPEDQITLTGSVEDNKLLLESSILKENFTLPSVMLSDLKLNLELTLAKNSFIETYLTFWNLLELPNRDPLKLRGTISYNSTHGMLIAKSAQIWEKALDLDFLQISQFKMKGAIKDNAPYIEDIVGEGYAIWGKECYNNVEGTNKTLNKEKCFFGMTDVLINVVNPQKSHLKGVYKNITPSHLLESILGYNKNSQEEGKPVITIPQQFLSHKFTDYVEITYVPPKNDGAVLLEMTEETEKIEAGMFLKGTSQMLGLEGVTSLRLKPGDKRLDGWFNFEPADIVFNNIVLGGGILEEQSGIEMVILSPEESGWMKIKGPARILDLDAEANWEFLDNSVSISATLNSNVFEEIAITGTSNDVDLKTAKFNWKGEVVSSFEGINNDVTSRFKEWTSRIKKVFDKVQEDLKSLGQTVELKQKELCHENECQVRSQCITEPVRQCIKNPSKEVCEKSTKQCKEAKVVCQNQENGVCTNLVYQCNQFEDVCESFTTIKDETQCQKYKWGCEESFVQNFECQIECERKKKTYDKFKSGLDEMKQNYDNLGNITRGLESYLASVGDDLLIQIDKMTFQIVVDRKISTNDIIWNLVYKVKGVENSGTLETLSLTNFGEAAEKIFEEIGKAEAAAYNFDWKNFQDYQEFLAKQMEGSIPVNILLESNQNTQVDEVSKEIEETAQNFSSEGI